MSSTILAPFQLLELNVISAQDLASLSRSMRTYAVAWVHPERKLSTRIDTYGHNNPTWNDKFVFRLDEEFIRTDTSAVMVEIYALHWFKDVHVGIVRVLVSNLIPPINKRPYKNHNPQVGTRFVALQVRRPSSRPQGILNIGIALLHSSTRSMPLYSQLSTSAVGYKELMGESEYSRNFKSNTSQQLSFGKPQLRHTKSDSSSMLGSDMRAKEFRGKPNKGKASSEVNSSTTLSKKQRKKGKSKASSLLSGSSSEIRKRSWRNKKVKKKESSLVDRSEVIIDAKTNSSSIVSSSEANSDLPFKKVFDEMPMRKKHMIESSMPNKGIKVSPGVIMNNMKTPARTTPGKSTFGKFEPYGYSTPAIKSNLVSRTYMTESELGPSASEVAVAIAKNKADDNESSILAYSIDESVEGLQSKLERWRTELPPVYDRGGEMSSYMTSSEGRHTRRHTDGGGGNGLFSCFGNICGCECSIVCGGGNKRSKKKGKGGKNNKIYKSPSVDNVNYVS